MAIADDKKLKGSKIRGIVVKEVQKPKKRTTIFDGIEPRVGKKEDISDYQVVRKVAHKKIGGQKIRKINDLDREEIKTIDRLNPVDKKIRTRKIHDLGRNDKEEEERLDKEINSEDNLSITLIIIILVICFIVGIFLGYMLYRIAINSSNVVFIVKNFFQ